MKSWRRWAQDESAISILSIKFIDKITLIWAQIVCSTHSLIERYIVEILIPVLQPTKHMQPRCGTKKKSSEKTLQWHCHVLKTLVTTIKKRRFEHIWYPVVIQNWCVNGIVVSLNSHTVPVPGATESSGWANGVFPDVELCGHVEVFKPHYGQHDNGHCDHRKQLRSLITWHSSRAILRFADEALG